MNIRSSAARRGSGGRFRAQPGRFDGLDATTLEAGPGGARALIAHHGATLLSWQVPTPQGPLELLDGYRSRAELVGQDGVRNGVLAPFQNRVAQARYRFEGRDHDLLPGVPAGARLIYHGFARQLDFTRVHGGPAPEGISAIFASDAIRPGRFAGYPFALSLRVRVGLGERSLSLRIEATNTGHSAAPVTLGWHPYFRLADHIRDLQLQIPADELVLTGPDLIPLPGAAARAPLDRQPGMDFRRPRALGEQALDCCYAATRSGPDGLVRSWLADPASGHRLEIWQRGGLVHLFTGDTLARSRRTSVAIEPVDAPTDAFNRSECRDEILLAPGDSRFFECGAVFHPAPSDDALRANPS